MPSKPRTLAGILRGRRLADQEYNRARRDPLVARIHGSARWQAVRDQVLRDEPVCRECARLGLTEPATQVDHIVPIVVAPERAFDRANLQPLCTACHGRKSAQERARAARPGNRSGAAPRTRGPTQANQGAPSAAPGVAGPGVGGPPVSQADGRPSARGGVSFFSRVSRGGGSAGG